MKRLLALLLVMAMVVAYVPFTTAQAATDNTTGFAGGSGTAEDPYLVSTKYHLDNVRNYPDASFKMINDIEFTDDDFSLYGDFYNESNYWDPIDDFTGTFDGGNHIIYNLRIDRVDDNVGLFGTVKSGKICNIRLMNVDIYGEDNVGSIAGYLAAESDTYIENCYTDGVLGGRNYVGGICGRVSSRIATSNILCCFNRVNISAQDYVGGILGYLSGTPDGGPHYYLRIEQCINEGTISVPNNNYKIAAGILGYEESHGCSYHKCYVSKITNCLNKGEVTGYRGAGIAYGACRELKYCYNIGTIDCNYTYPISSYSGYTSCYDLESNGEEALSNKRTFVNWDFNDVWTMAGDLEYPYPELQCFTLQGKPGIAGDVVCNSTVMVDFSTLSCKPSVYTCTWRVDGKEVAMGDAYTIQASDVGKNLTVIVTSADIFCAGSVASAKYAVGKAVQTAVPVIPTLITMTQDMFEITTVPTQEYSIDNVNWQVSGVFENLEPEKTYIVYTRILETDVYLRGASTEVLKVYLTAICNHEWAVSIMQPATYTSMGKMVNTCIRCGETTTESIPAKFYGTSINLGNTLDMYFGFCTGLVDEGGKVVFVREFADGTTETTEAPITSFKKNNSVYDITYTGLAAKEMCDTIHVYVYNGNGELVGQHSDSIRSYVLRQLREKNYEQEFRTLCVDLLNYGAAAQVEFGYRENDLANKDLTPEELAEGTQTVATYTDKQSIVGNATSYYGTAYILETKISMMMAVRGDRIGADCYALVSYTDHTGTPKSNIRVEGKKNYSVYEFELNEIVVADGRCLLTIEFYKADGTKVLTVQDSMESYTARNAADYPLAEKMLAFSDSAYNYLHRNDQ